VELFCHEHCFVGPTPDEDVVDSGRRGQGLEDPVDEKGEGLGC